MDNYRNNHTIDEILTIGEERPLPDEIYSAISPFIHRAYFGTLPTLNRFYCIVDNSIYFWSINPNNKHVDSYIDERSLLITYVFDCSISPEYFNQNTVIGIIVYGTNNSLKLVPVSETEIFFEAQIELRINFFVSCCYSNKKGQLFLGTNKGDIYLFTYSYNKTSGDTEKKIKNVTARPFPKSLISIFLIDFPIIQICVDEATQILAALHSNSVIKFYQIDDMSLHFIFQFKSDQFGCIHQQYGIQRISSIPLNKGNLYQFVVFYGNGARLFFAADEFVVDVVKIKPPPPNSINDIFFDATIYPTHTVFFYERHLVFVLKNRDKDDGVESYVTLPLQSELLSVSPYISNLPFIEEKYNNSNFLQHISPPININIITSTGTRTINLKMPYNYLFSLFTEVDLKKDTLTSQKLLHWASENYLESMVTALLLASKRPEMKRRCLYFIRDMINMQQKKPIEPIYSAAHVFSSRIERVIIVGWFDPLFQMKENGFVLNSYFKNTNVNRIKELADIKSLIKDYQKDLMNKPETIEEVHLYNNLTELVNYCDQFSNIYMFVSLVEKLDDTLINSCLWKLEKKYRDRLYISEFGSNSPLAQSLIKTFHQFCMALFEINPSDDFLSQVQEKCNFFDSSAFIVWTSIKRIQSEPKLGHEMIIQKDIEILVENITQVMNLDDICPFLKQRNMMSSIVKLCVAKARSIDPFSLALSWFRSDRTLTKDRKGIDLFDRQYKFFEIVFDLIETEDDIIDCLNSDDELFYNCFYDFLIGRHKFECVIKMAKKAPFLKTFIKNEHPEQLWKYFAFRGKYEKAAHLIYMHVHKSNSLTIYEIIQLLKKAFSYSFSNESLRLNIKKLILFCEIQVEFMGRIHNQEEYESGICRENDLFSQITVCGFWDLALRLSTVVKINTSNFDFVVSQLWENFFISYLDEMDLQNAMFTLDNLFNHLKSFLHHPVCKLDIIVPIFETYSIEKLGDTYLFFDFFLKKKFNIDLLTRVYLSITSNDQMERQVRCRYIDVCTHAFSLGASFKRDTINDLKNWFANNGSDYDRYEEVIQFFYNI